MTDEEIFKHMAEMLAAGQEQLKAELGGRMDQLQGQIIGLRSEVRAGNERILAEISDIKESLKSRKNEQRERR